MYLAYNIYRSRLRDEMFSPETLEEHQAIWDAAVAENIFVICKAPMAKRITERTLLGFRKGRTNMWAPEDLINKIKNQPELFIKKVHDLVGKDVKIKAIVGNPPYQEMDGGAGVSAAPVYHLFTEICKQLNPNYFSLIMPARWFAGGKGLDDFRARMLNDNRLTVIHDVIVPQDVFPTVQIKGGICYFLWDSLNPKDCTVVTHFNGVITSTAVRPLLEEGLDTFIRFNEAVNIIHKVRALKEPSIKSIVSARKPFGLDTTYKGAKSFDSHNTIKVYQNGGIGFTNKDVISKNTQLIDGFKVYIPRASSGSDNFPHPVLGQPFVGEPNSCCSETYMVIGSYDNNIEPHNLVRYIRSKFVRFLALQLKSTQDTPAFIYQLVPMQDFTANSDIDWSKSIEEIDAQLFKKYNLSDEEIDFIKSMIKPM